MAGEGRRRQRVRHGPTMSGSGKRGRTSSQGFRPVKQVGVAPSNGLPVLMIGVMVLFTAYSSGRTVLWVAGGVLVLIGCLGSSSGRVI